MPGVELGAAGARLRRVGADRRLHRLLPLAIDEIAGITAALAAALADLHDLGEVHGPLAAEHIILRDDTLALDDDVSHRRHGTDDHAGPADDIASLGRLVAWMLERAGASPGHRRRRARRRRVRTAPAVARPAPRRGRPLLWSPPPADVLADLAARCTHPNPRHRPSARAVEITIRAGIPAARLPSRTADDELVIQPVTAPPRPAARLPCTARGQAPERGRQPVRRGAIAALALAVAALVIGVAVAVVVSVGTAVPPGSSPSRSQDRPPKDGLERQSGASRAGSAPGVVAGAPPVMARTGVLTVDGHRYAIGEADDRAAWTAFGCGPPSLVVLRRPEGGVFLFDQLPHDADTVTGRLAGVFDGALDLDVEADGRGCPLAFVRRRDGTRVLVAPEAGRTEERR